MALVMHTFNRSACEAETEESLGFVSSLSSINVSINECEGLARDPVFKM